MMRTAALLLIVAGNGCGVVAFHAPAALKNTLPHSPSALAVMSAPLLTMTDKDDNLATAFNVAKCVLGAGGFALPWAFAKCGVAGAVGAVVFCSALGSYTVGELFRSKQVIEELNGFAPEECFADTAGLALPFPGCVSGTTASYVDMARSTYGTAGATLVFALTCACSIGVTSSYLEFISSTLQSLAVDIGIVADAALLPDSGTCVCAVAALATPLTLLTSNKALARVAQSGTVAVLLGYLVCLFYVFDAGLLSHLWDGSVAAPQGLRLFTSVPEFLQGFGSIAYLFCVHFLLPPISDSSASTARGGFAHVVTAVFLLTGAVNLLFGLAGYAAFGSDVSSLVLNDLGSRGGFLEVTKALLCVDLLCTYPLVFQAGRSIVERLVVDEQETESEEGGVVVSSPRRVAVRLALVALTAAIAQQGDFGELISLVGGFCQVITAFAVPAAIAIALGEDRGAARNALNAALLPAGALLAIGTAYIDLSSAA
jgi:proton-coupled amino acid transporter